MSNYNIKHTEKQQKFQHQINSILSEIVQKPNTLKTFTDSLFELYIKLFGQIPNIIELDWDGTYLNPEYEDLGKKSNKFNIIQEEETIFGVEPSITSFNIDTNSNSQEEEEFYTFKKKDIMEARSALNIINNYSGEQIVVYRSYEDPVIIMGDDLKAIYYKYEHYLRVLCTTDELPEYIKNNIVVDEDGSDEVRYFDYVVYDNHGFNTTELPIKKQAIDLELNYNDDIPHEYIKSFINNAESGLCILHGNPGTGKTTYIRHLMRECKDANFMILNTSCFDAINDTSFVNLIVNHQGAIIILEDCEDMLSERMNGNSRIATLLNLSDGILGDALRLKFICTFNAKLGKIDPAILRKGRTHVKYEFKELSKEKAEKLAKSIGKELPEKKGNAGYTLADIYNVDNDLVDSKIGNKVGFSK